VCCHRTVVHFILNGIKHLLLATVQVATEAIEQFTFLGPIQLLNMYSLRASTLNISSLKVS
jgi:hypothetical protein